MLVKGTRQDTETLRDQIATVLAGLGLRFSGAKTRVVHMSEGFSFLGFGIQWRRQRGTSKWHIYTFIDDRPIRSLKAKIRALTRRTSQLDPGWVLTRLGQVMHGWASYFRHAVAKNVFSMLDDFAWRRVIRMLMTRHRWRWKDIRRQFTTPLGPVAADHRGRDRVADDHGNTGHPVPLPRHQNPQPLGHCRNSLTAGTAESPLRPEAHGRFGERPGETGREQSRHRAPGLLSAICRFPPSKLSHRCRSSAMPGDAGAAARGSAVLPGRAGSTAAVADVGVRCTLAAASDD